MNPSNSDTLTSDTAQLSYLGGDGPNQNLAEASLVDSVSNGSPFEQTSRVSQSSQSARKFQSQEKSQEICSTTSQQKIFTPGEVRRKSGDTSRSYTYKPQRQSYSSKQSGVSQDASIEIPLYAGPVPENAGDDDADSGLGANDSAHSTSLIDQAYNFRHFNGRRYHAEQSSGTEYHLPNDELELDRLDLQHNLFLLTLNGSLYCAPLPSDIKSVLDVGTGTGIWAIDFADIHPACVVIGTDLSPIQPAYVPPNCRFYVEDAEESWNFDEPFDYIHVRMLVVSIKNWSKFFHQAYANLKPGGYIELQDLNFPPRCDDGSAPPDSPMMQWCRYLIEGAHNLGLDVEASSSFPALLAEAGFIDIQSETHAWPMNSWPKDKAMKQRGMWAMQNFLQGLHGFTMAYFTKGLGWKPAEVEVMVSQVRAQTRDKRSHVYTPASFIWARKPMTDATIATGV